MQIPSILPHIITQISRIALKNYNYVSYTLVDFAEKSTNESEDSLHLGSKLAFTLNDKTFQ